jgi:drug/metabolite transporter (DMT)-like permease
LLGIGGFLGIGIGVVFMLYSMETIGVVATGLFSSASPMITSFLGIILFKERKSLIKIVGISLIIIGLIIVSI